MAGLAGIAHGLRRWWGQAGIWRRQVGYADAGEHFSGCGPGECKCKARRRLRRFRAGFRYACYAGRLRRVRVGVGFRSEGGESGSSAWCLSVCSGSLAVSLLPLSPDSCLRPLGPGGQECLTHGGGRRRARRRRQGLGLLRRRALRGEGLGGGRLEGGGQLEVLHVDAVGQAEEARAHAGAVELAWCVRTSISRVGSLAWCRIVLLEASIEPSNSLAIRRQLASDQLVALVGEPALARSRSAWSRRPFSRSLACACQRS